MSCVGSDGPSQLRSNANAHCLTGAHAAAVWSWQCVVCLEVLCSLQPVSPWNPCERAEAYGMRFLIAPQD